METLKLNTKKIFQNFIWQASYLFMNTTEAIVYNYNFSKHYIFGFPSP